MRKLVGISLKIRRVWIDATLAHVVQTTDEGELRAFLDGLLKQDLPGAQVRGKTAGILMRMWGSLPEDRIPLRDRALALVPQLSGDEVIWLHWGMALLAYPFFRDTAEVIGRILALQNDVSTPQVQARLTTAWGDRLTSRKAARYLLNTLVDWDVLRATDVRGHFAVARKLASANLELQLWLLEALLRASDANELEVQQLLRLPESFPFTFSAGVGALRQHDRMTIHRQGVDMDMVALTYVASAAPPKATKRSRSGAPGASGQQDLFRDDEGTR